MAVRIYRDLNANAVVIEGSSVGMKFTNELQAVGNGDDTISIHNPSKETEEDFLESYNLDYSEYLDGNGDPLGANEEDTVNALNAIFRNTGIGVGAAPVITSPTTINLVTGDSLNYELTATDGVGYEWENLPAGVTTVEGNIRKLIGGSSLIPNTYNFTAKAVNYFGEDSETISLIVSSPTFSNTKSIQFNNNDNLNANASLLSSVLGRAGNGSGSSDAWTISFYFKAGTSNNTKQTILYYGGDDADNESHIRLTYKGNQNRLEFRYGSNNNHLLLDTATGTLPSGTWKHLVLTYDGGTTGVSSGDIASYYGRFEIFIDGVSVLTTNSHSNFGTAQAVLGEVFRIGRNGNGRNYMRKNCKIDEFAVWNSDQTTNVAAIYNGGVPHDLFLLANQPTHWWRMGDGDTFPTLQDSVGSADFTMLNMTAADIVSDVP